MRIVVAACRIKQAQYGSKNGRALTECCQYCSWKDHETFFSKNQIQTPILTSNDCEGAGEVFTVLPASQEAIKLMKKESIQVLENDTLIIFTARLVSVGSQLWLRL